MARSSRPGSVRGMLLILLLPAGIGLMALAWFIHGMLLERMSQDFVESRLRDESAFLEHQIRQSGGQINALRTGDYFQEVFHHSFAIASPSGTSVSPAAWAPLLEPLLTSEQQGVIRVDEANVPGAPADILAYRRTFRVNERPIVVVVSEDMEALQASQSELHTWTAVMSILLIVLLVASIWMGISLAMSPIVSIQAALRRLQGGEISRINTRAPEEFRPLVEQINQLLDSLDQRLVRSRDALANLSHSVKTPIAAVRQILEDTSRPLNNELRHEMAARLDDINRQLEAEMRRSRFAGPQAGTSAYPVKQARDLLWMLGRLHPEKSFDLSTDLTPERRWPLEEHDLNEMLGNLLDNAGKWSAGCVELCLQEGPEQMRIIVRDDGPGVEVSALEQLGRRGLRLDEQTPGHGLGLAIVVDIVERYGGTLHFATSSQGGLEVSVAIKKKRSSTVG